VTRQKPPNSTGKLTGFPYKDSWEIFGEPGDRLYTHGLERELIDRSFKRARELGATDLCLTMDEVSDILAPLELSAPVHQELAEQLYYLAGHYYSPGYRLENRKLIVDEEEACTVRVIFERYIALRSIGQLVDELAERGVRTKVRRLKDGRVTGDVPFRQGPLAALLKNPLYIGKVAHGGVLHEGEHEAIIDETLWADVQSCIASNRYSRKVGLGVRYPSLLTGMLSNPDGVPMTPTFTTRGIQRHHYYITRLKPGDNRKEAWRVPAGEIDRRVIAALSDWLRSGAADDLPEDARNTREQLTRRSEFAVAISGMSVAEQRQLLLDWRVTVQLGTNQLSIQVGDGAAAISIKLPAHLAHRGPELRLIIPASADLDRTPDPVLVKLVVLARTAQKSLVSGEPDPLISHYGKRHLWQLLRISWLAPDIIAAIMNGTQPATLTGRRLLRATDIPLNWKAQRAHFQFN
jgi:site-specific DNA recombinase